MVEGRRDRALRRIGALEASSVGFGAARIAIEGRPPWNTGVEVVKSAVAAGMTLIDTADAYCLESTAEHGYGERLVAAGLRNIPGEGVVIATKGGEIRKDGLWKLIGRPEHLREACEASLRRLEMDAIDLYQLHRPDPAVPLEESLGAMTELRERGLIREMGVCNVTLEELERALSAAPVAAVQNPLSVGRSDQDLIIELCEQEGIAFLAHSPFGGPGDAARIGMDRRLARAAGAHGVSPYDIALAALLARSPAIIPIPGTANPARPAQHARASRLTLGAAGRALWPGL
ncbi:aldo/keto reductase [Candidatus Spongiisocius sp.]|uniref:aldo/keto reductase n=1 Tax=Candidatus Spongiisocius sp. TaxID=3101273 RepID=UPI003B5C6DB2